MILDFNQNELDLFFTLTIILIITKAILATFLGYKIVQRKKQTGEFGFGFVFGVFALMICLLISRIVFIYFDFVLTKFDSSKLHLSPNVDFWRVGMFLILLGYSIFLFITDKKVLDFKFKGIISYILIAIALIIVIYPVSSASDFQFISTLSIGANVVAVIIPILFFYLARQESPYRMASLAIAMGVIFYAIGANLVVELLLINLEQTFGSNIRITFWFLSLIFKISGLSLFSFGVTKFAVKFSN